MTLVTIDYDDFDHDGDRPRGRQMCPVCGRRDITVEWPGPRVVEVVHVCPTCGGEIRFRADSAREPGPSDD